MTDNYSDPTAGIQPRHAGTDPDLLASDLSVSSPTGLEGTGATSSEGDQSKTEAVKGEASEVGQQAAESAKRVAGTAKQEAASVASEASSQVKGLLSQAGSDLSDQASTQQQKVAQGLRAIGDQLHSMASSSEESGVATDLVRQAGERSSAIAQWLEDREPGALLDEAKSFGRRRPGVFLAVALGAGILAGRVTRGLTSGATDNDASGASPTNIGGPRATTGPAVLGTVPDAGLPAYPDADPTIASSQSAMGGYEPLPGGYAAEPRPGAFGGDGLEGGLHP